VGKKPYNFGIFSHEESKSLVEHAEVVEFNDFINDFNSLLSFSVAKGYLEVETKGVPPEVMEEDKEVVNVNAWDTSKEISAEGNFTN